MIWGLVREAEAFEGIFFFSQSRGIFSERERQGRGLKKIGRLYFF